MGDTAIRAWVRRDGKGVGPAELHECVPTAIDPAGLNNVRLDLEPLGGSGSVLIRGLSILDVKIADFG